MRKLLFAISLAAIAAPAAAVVTPAAPSFTLALPPTGATAAADPSLAGTVVSDTLTPFTSAGGLPIHGTVQVRSVRATDGKLTLYWKINNDASSAGSVTAILGLGFPLQSYDANWRKDGLGTVAPGTVVALNPGGIQMIGFGFGAMPVHPGESSRFVFLKTGKTTTVPGSAILSFGTGGNSQPFAALRPGPK